MRDPLTQKDDNWEEWSLADLVENLRKYTDRNPLPEVDGSSPSTLSKPLRGCPREQHGKDKLFLTNRPQSNPTCVYCGMNNHRSKYCTEVIKRHFETQMSISGMYQMQWEAPHITL